MPFDLGPSRIATRASRTRIELLRPPTPKRFADGLAKLLGRLEPDPRPMPARFAFHDIGTYYQVTSANVSGYRETATESPITWTGRDRAHLRDRLLANIGTASVGGSGRRIESTVRLQSASDETDGTLTTLVLGGRRFDLLAATDTWCEMAPQADRLAALSTLPPSQSITAAIAAVEAESRESWDAESRSRTGTDGTIVAHLTDGRYRLAVESVRSFYSFDTADSVNFKSTEDPAFERPDAPAMSVAYGDSQSTSVDVWLVPQMHQWRLDWTARYLFINIFGAFEVVSIANTGAFLSRLPFYPVRYSMTLIGSAVQAASVSRALARTQTYATMILNDIRRQSISPFGVLLLDGRVNGEWRIFQREVRQGQLVGVLRYRYQGGPPIVRYVWRRTTDAREFTLLDNGSLNVPGEVTGTGA